ncbi:hypothetical protein Golomagni_06948, partial [Golovinomyces magnicellulatus]
FPGWDKPELYVKPRKGKKHGEKIAYLWIEMDFRLRALFFNFYFLLGSCGVRIKTRFTMSESALAEVSSSTGAPATNTKIIVNTAGSQTECGDPHTEEKFKEGGYGWVVVVCVALVNVHTWGLNASFAVFLAHYLNSGQFDDTGPVVFAFVGGLAFSIALLTAPVVTIMVSYLGSRLTLALGVLIQTSALIAASFSNEIWHLILSQGLCFGGSSAVGLLRTPSQPVALASAGSSILSPQTPSSQISACHGHSEFWQY